jgi:hypothetical protein
MVGYNVKSHITSRFEIDIFNKDIALSITYL